MNPENALWLLDVMTAEVRRLSVMVDRQTKTIMELESKLGQKDKEDKP